MGCWLEGSHTCSKCCTVHICIMHAPAYTIVSSLCPLHSHQLVRTELERLGSVWCWLADLKLCSWIRGIGSFISTQEICFAAGNWRLHCYGLDEHWREELSLGPGSYALCLSVAVDTVKPDVNLSTCQPVRSLMIPSLKASRFWATTWTPQTKKWWECMKWYKVCRKLVY